MDTGSCGRLSGFGGVQHYTQYPIDFCMMMWYNGVSRTKSSSNATMWN